VISGTATARSTIAWSTRAQYWFAASGVERLHAQSSPDSGSDPKVTDMNEAAALRDLYVMGDLSKSEYVLRRQALEEELAHAAPPFDPRLDKAKELLADFGRVWELEDDPAKRRRSSQACSIASGKTAARSLP
jgi:hypothetical protein